MKSRRYGSFEVFAPSQALKQVDGPTVDASTAAFEMAGVGPADMDVLQLQDTESGAEVMHMAENGFCEHGEQESLIQSRRHAYRRQHADQHRRWLPGQRRAHRCLRLAPGL